MGLVWYDKPLIDFKYAGCHYISLQEGIRETTNEPVTFCHSQIYDMVCFKICEDAALSCRGMTSPTSITN